MTGPFPAILGKGPCLELGKNMQHFGVILGTFLEVKQLKKPLKYVHDHDDFIHVYKKSISYYYHKCQSYSSAQRAIMRLFFN